MNADGMQLTSAVRTDVGKVRRINEDACAAWPLTGIWVVADGMGGHDAGDLASSSIVEALQVMARARAVLPDKQGFEAVGQDARGQARQRQPPAEG